MIVYKDIKRYDNLEFSEYLKLGGFSNSFLKGETNGEAKQIDITDNMRIGSLVDGILTEPSKVDFNNPLYDYAKDIAAELKRSLGGIIDNMQKQVSFTAIASFEGFELPVTGRLDFLIERQAVVDLKITKSKHVGNLIQYMGYTNQLWNYCKMANVANSYLIVYSIPEKRCHIVKVSHDMLYNEFWASKILKFGNVKQFN